MRYFITIFLICILGFTSCKKKITYEEFKPASFDYINSIKYECIVKFDSTKGSFSNFKSIWEHSSYGFIYDSLEKKCRETDKFSTCTRWIMKLRFSEKIHGVLKFRILRFDSINTTQVILYEDYKYDYNQPGYWIALSIDRGIHWNNYYTGLTKGSFYYFNPKSSIPLFINDSTIQIESALIRMTEPRTLPIGSPTYELVRDKLIITISLNKIRLDSDNDGLTDIEENKLMTNPFNSDSDGDGIIDSKDNNPRYKNEDNDFSLLFRYFLEGKRESCFLPFHNSNIDYNRSSNNCDTIKKVFMIVTDDSNIKHISQTKNTYIILTKNEYKDYKKVVPEEPESMNLEIERTKFFSKEYKVSVDGSFWGINYKVIKTDAGWIIKKTGSYLI